MSGRKYGRPTEVSLRPKKHTTDLRSGRATEEVGERSNGGGVKSPIFVAYHQLQVVLVRLCLKSLSEQKNANLLTHAPDL